MKKVFFMFALSVCFVMLSAHWIHALESLWLYVGTEVKLHDEILNPIVLTQPLQPEKGYQLVAGTITAAGFSVPSTHHITLLDPQGRNIPLWIERASLRYDSDAIVSMFVVFQIPKRTNLTIPLRLIWSHEPEPLMQNQEKQVIHLPDDLSPILGFRLEPMSAHINSVQSTVLIEVDTREGRYRIWYLFPMILILGFYGYDRFRRKEIE